MRTGPLSGRRAEDRGRLRLAVLVALGLLGILGGAAVALLVSGGGSTDGPRALGVLAVSVGLIVVVWKLWRSPDGADVEPAPWTDDGALVDEAPERLPAGTDVSGTGLTTAVERAAERARAERTVREGLDEVRPMLRSTLLEALVEGGADHESARAALATGDWTDDGEAAAVLDGTVPPPDRSLRRRLWAWLYPGRAVRRRVGRAVAAVADAADEALPPVVGQRAPRPMPIGSPSADQLQAGDAEGTATKQATTGSRAVAGEEAGSDGAAAAGAGPGFAKGADGHGANADGPRRNEREEREDRRDGSAGEEWPTADGGPN